MNDIYIEKANESDIEEITRLFIEGDLFHHQLDPEIFAYTESARPEEMIHNNINSDESDYFLAKHGTRIVGLLNIKTMTVPDIPILVPNSYAQIENIIVTGEYRKKGIGKLLINCGIEWAREHGIKDIRLSVFAKNTDAVGFYEMLGFSPSSMLYRLKIE